MGGKCQNYETVTPIVGQVRTRRVMDTDPVSDRESFCQVGSGITVPYPDITFLTRKSVFLQIFLRNGPYIYATNIYVPYRKSSNISK